MAYVSGNPIMSDEEFDKLKQQLKIDGSDIVVEGPRCSRHSRNVYSDLNVDYLKMFLLNDPTVVVALGLFFFLDDLTGFEITYLLEVKEWAKNHYINDSKSGSLNSYSLSLLVIFHLHILISPMPYKNMP